jgi:hypothetical protein
MRRIVRIGNKTQSLEFDTMFSFKNGRVTLNTDNSLAVNGGGQIIVNPGGGSIFANIPHLPSAPAAIAGVTQPWILDDGAGNVDHDHIFLVFPVGGDNNKCITLSDIIFTP